MYQSIHGFILTRFFTKFIKKKQEASSLQNESVQGAQKHTQDDKRGNYVIEQKVSNADLNKITPSISKRIMQRG